MQEIKARKGRVISVITEGDDYSASPFGIHNVSARLLMKLSHRC
jgi:hypothetical protein